MRTPYPIETLPNGGIVRHPDSHALEHQPVIAEIASISDPVERRHASEGYAADVIGQDNASLSATAKRLKETISGMHTVSVTDQFRHVTFREAARLYKSVTTTKDHVRRNTIEQFITFIAFVIVFGLAFCEGKLLANVVMFSGTLGLDPGRWGDWWFAAAFAAPTIALAILKRGRHETLETFRERRINSRKVYRSAHLWFLLWLPTVALLFGPALLSSGGSQIDPFREISQWAETAVRGLVDVKLVLQVVGFALVTLLMIFNILMCSTVGAAILIYERQLHADSKDDDVRESEEYLKQTHMIEEKQGQLEQLSHHIGQLEGILQEIDNACSKFARQLGAQVEAARVRGELAGRAALYRTTQSNIVDASDQFPRR